MRTAIAVLMAFTLVLAPASAIAQENEESYDLNVSDERAEITMPHEAEGQAGETTVVLDTEEGLLSGGFGFAEAEDAGSQLDIRLHQVVEYRDANDSGHLDDEDEIASAWNLANASENATAEPNGTVEWEALETANVTSEDDVEGTQVQGVATFTEEDPIAGVMHELGQGDNRTLTITLTVFEDAATYEGTEVPASHVHVAWTLENYPYTSEDSELALVAEANGTGTLHLDVGEEEPPRIASQSELDGFDVGIEAELAEQAIVDDDETDVTVAPIEAHEDAEIENLVALHYERGDVIEHELVMGANVQTLDESTIDSATDQFSEVPAPGALVAVGLLAGAAAAFRRG